MSTQHYHHQPAAILEAASSSLPPAMSAPRGGTVSGTTTGSRTVTFSDCENCKIISDVPDSWDGSPEHAQLIWYQVEDYMFFKATAHMIAKEARAHGLNRHILDYMFCSERCRGDNDASVQQRLNRWVRHSMCSRGLERWIHNKSMKQRRAADIIYPIHMVLETQARLRGQDSVSDHDMACEIASVSERCTAIASRNARMMGLADQYAAAQVLQRQTPLYSYRKVVSTFGNSTNGTKPSNVDEAPPPNLTQSIPTTTHAFHMQYAIPNAQHHDRDRNREIRISPVPQ